MCLLGGRGHGIYTPVGVPVFNRRERYEGDSMRLRTCIRVSLDLRARKSRDTRMQVLSRIESPSYLSLRLKTGTPTGVYIPWPLPPSRHTPALHAIIGTLPWWRGLTLGQPCSPVSTQRLMGAVYNGALLSSAPHPLHAPAWYSLS